MKIYTFFLLALVFSSFSYAVDLTNITELTDEEEIACAVKIKENMDIIQDRIKICKKNGESHEDCLCENEDAFIEQMLLIKGALENHTNWLEIGWFKFKYKEKYINFNANGLQKQSNMKLNCI